MEFGIVDVDDLEVNPEHSALFAVKEPNTFIEGTIKSGEDTWPFRVILNPRYIPTNTMFLMASRLQERPESLACVEVGCNAYGELPDKVMQWVLRTDVSNVGRRQYAIFNSAFIEYSFADVYKVLDDAKTIIRPIGDESELQIQYLVETYRERTEQNVPTTKPAAFKER